MATKSMRLREWLWGIILAAPIVAGYVIARRTNGWVSVVAYVVTCTAVVSLITVGIAYEFRAWREVLEDENPHNDSHKSS